MVRSPIPKSTCLPRFADFRAMESASNLHSYLVRKHWRASVFSTRMPHRMGHWLGVDQQSICNMCSHLQELELLIGRCWCTHGMRPADAASSRLQRRRPSLDTAEEVLLTECMAPQALQHSLMDLTSAGAASP